MIFGCWRPGALRARSRACSTSARNADSFGLIWRRSTLPSTKHFQFLWVSDFPMFEWDKNEKRWNPAHHPFTTLHEEDMAKLEANIDSVHDPKSPLGEIRALAYDVVLNGTELG